MIGDYIEKKKSMQWKLGLSRGLAVCGAMGPTIRDDPTPLGIYRSYKVIMAGPVCP